MKQYSAKEIYEQVEGEKELTGNAGGIIVQQVRPLTDADEHSLVWLSPKKKEMQEYIGATPAPLLIVASDFDTSAYSNKCFIKVPDPRLAFIRIAAKLFAPDSQIEWGIHPTAVVHPEAKIHSKSFIGPFCVIGRCEIGEGSILRSQCHLYDGVKIGKNVQIDACTVIGPDGFGFQRNENGEMQKFTHYGSVTIEDDVEIGSHVCIDRGTLGNTMIREGVKIDNLCHIAHNVDIGKHTVVIAGCSIGGSAKIGEFCWLAPSSTILENVKIGNYARVGLGAVVVKDVPEHANMVGNPAIDFRIRNKS